MKVERKCNILEKKRTGGDDHDFAEAARNAAIAMRDDIKQYVTVV